MPCVLQVVLCSSSCKPGSVPLETFADYFLTDEQHPSIVDLEKKLLRLGDLSLSLHGTTILHAAVNHAIWKGDRFSLLQLETVLDFIGKEVDKSKKTDKKIYKDGFPNSINLQGFTPFGIALMKGQGNYKVLETLAKKIFIDVNKVGQVIYNPLLSAIKAKTEKSAQIASILLKNDNIHLVSNDRETGYTPLHFIIVDQFPDLKVQEELIDKLLDRNNPNAEKHKNLLTKKDRDGMTPIALAAYYKNTPVFKRLLPQAIGMTESETKNSKKRWSNKERTKLFEILFQAKKSEDKGSSCYYSLFALAYLKRSDWIRLSASVSHGDYDYQSIFEIVLQTVKNTLDKKNTVNNRSVNPWEEFKKEIHDNIKAEIDSLKQKKAINQDTMLTSYVRH